MDSNSNSTSGVTLIPKKSYLISAVNSKNTAKKMSKTLKNEKKL